MKIIESHKLTLHEAVTFAKRKKVNVSYSQLSGILNKVEIRHNTFIIPGTFPKCQYLRFTKEPKKRGCCVEVCSPDSD